jgi:hypothetical protein
MDSSADAASESAKCRPYRADDPNNIPLAKARERFLEQLTLHTPILSNLLDEPVRCWNSLPTETQEQLRQFGWSIIEYLGAYSEIDPPDSEDPNTLRFYRALELLARRHHLTQDGTIVSWAMETAIATIDSHAQRPRREGTARWVHHIEMSQGYPARTESGWTSIAARMPEKELFPIQIEIPPKQPTESWKAFEVRFLKSCRLVLSHYRQVLKSAGWRNRPPYSGFTWIDRLAEWQAGHGAAQIASGVTLPAFSRGIKEAGAYIGITPRESKHNPRRRPGH